MTKPSNQEYSSRVQQWVDAGQNAFTSADALYQYLRTTDLYAPRSVVRDVWRETIAHKDYVPLINRLDPETLIPRTWIQQTDQNYESPYAVKVKVTGIMGDNNDVTEHFVTLLYDHQPRTGEISDDYVGIMEWSGMSYKPDTLAFTVERVYHKRGVAW